MENLIILFLILPLAAALLLGFFTLARSTCLLVAATVAILNLILAVAGTLASHWQNPAEVFSNHWPQFPWHSLWTLDFQLQLTTLAAPILTLASLSFLLTVSYLRAATLLRERLAALLFLQLAVNGALLSPSLFSFVFFSSMASLPAAFLVGVDTVIADKWPLHRFLSFELIGALLLGIAVVGTQNLTTLNLEEWFRFSTSSYTTETRTLLFFALSLGMLFRGLCYPFLISKRGFLQAQPIAALLPVLSLGGIGLYGLFRFCSALYPAEWVQYGGFFAALGVLTAIWSGLQLLRSNDHRENLFFLNTLFQGVILLGLASSQRYGLLGAWLLLSFSYLASSSYGLLLSVAEAGTAWPGQNNRIRPAYSGALYILVLLATFGFPVSMGFYGLFFVLWGTALWSKAFFLVSLVFLPLLLIAFAKNALSRPIEESGLSNLRFSSLDFSLSAPLALFLLFLGLSTNWIIGSALPTMDFYLRLLGRL